MSLYGYTGYSPNGKTVSGVIDAEDQATARRSLRDRGIFLTEPLDERKKEPLLIVSRLRWGKETGSRRSSRSFTLSAQDITDISAPGGRCLDRAGERRTDSRLKAVLAGVRDKVKDGEAIAGPRRYPSYPDVFNDLYVNMVAGRGCWGDAGRGARSSVAAPGKAGEGVDQGRGGHDVSRVHGPHRVRHSLVPLDVGGPEGRDGLSGREQGVPLPTRLITVFRRPFTVLAGHLRADRRHRVRRLQVLEEGAGKAGHRACCGSSAVCRGECSTPCIRRASGRTMEALLKGGVPLSRALGITSKAAGHLGMAKVLSRAEEAVLEGGSLTHSLRESRFFPESALSLMTIGETGGTSKRSLPGSARPRNASSTADWRPS